MKLYIVSKNESTCDVPNQSATLGVFSTLEKAEECMNNQIKKDMDGIHSKSKYDDIEFTKLEYPEDGDWIKGVIYEEYDYDIQLAYFIETRELDKAIVTDILEIL